MAAAGIGAHLGLELARNGYAKYGPELRALHKTLHAFCEPKGTLCLSCTLELELSYMRLRETKPRVIWEISPASGFSTQVILHALAANANNATLHSFDILDRALRHSLSPSKNPTLAPLWSFHRGDTKRLVAVDGTLDPAHPPPDYLFLDSKHNEAMATFYTTRLLPAVQRIGHTYVSLHDVYNPLFWYDGGGPKRDLISFPEWMPNLEGAMVLDWLGYGFQSDSCQLFTIAPSKVGNRPFHEAVLKARESLAGLARDELVDKWEGKCPEPTIYFELNCSAPVVRSMSSVRHGARKHGGQGHDRSP
jgi:hypothetical protein